MAGDVIEVLAVLLGIQCRSGAEDLGDGFGGNESEAAQRREFSDGDSVSGDDEGLAFVKATHDLAAAVSELSLRDGLSHAEL